jgi:hypothetical protein
MGRVHESGSAGDPVEEVSGGEERTVDEAKKRVHRHEVPKGPERWDATASGQGGLKGAWGGPDVGGCGSGGSHGVGRVHGMMAEVEGQRAGKKEAAMRWAKVPR